MNCNEYFNRAMMGSPFSTVGHVRSLTAPIMRTVHDEELNLKNLEKADKHILKKISTNDNLKSVYVPLMLVNNAMLILAKVRDTLAKTIKADPSVFNKYGKTKKIEEILKATKENLDEYEHQLHGELEDKRMTLVYSSEEFYDIMVKTYSSLLSYSEIELHGAHPESDGNTITFVGCCHLVVMLLEYKDQFELKCCKMMQECLKGTTLSIHQKTPIWHIRFKNHALRMIELMEMPTQLNSDMVKLYRKVMSDKIEKIDMIKLTDTAVKRRVDSMNL